MKTEILNERFINAIKDKIPQRAAIANRLVEILCIEKEAVYRRMRNEVPFSFTETAIVATALGISLDNIVGSIAEKSKPFILKLVDFITPTEEDFEMTGFLIKYVDSLNDFTGTEYGNAMNMIPVTLSVKYENIFRFYVYKWYYQNFSPVSVKSFSDVYPHPEIIKRLKEFPHLADQAEKSFYIWDEAIFSNIVKDISYFNAINLISGEEKDQIKKELLLLLDEIELLATKGVNEQGNKVYIYISNVSFETSYSYIQSPDIFLTMIMTFTLNDIVSVDESTFQRVKQFMQSLKRTATLISESGEMYRIRFFETQRDIVNQL